MNMRVWVAIGMLWVVAGGLVACGQSPSPSPSSYLEGKISVDPSIDSTQNFSGFEVLVLRQGESTVDTLAYAVTDSTGYFSTSVDARERGVYPLYVVRYGQVLTQGDIAVAPGDSALLTLRLPHRGAFLRIRSPENAAWMAYRNIRATYGQELLQSLQSGNAAAMTRIVERTARMLWDLQNTYPGTIGAEVAQAEAVSLVQGWNDSLAIAWALQVAPEQAGYVEVARAARQAAARVGGLDSAIVLLKHFQQRAVETEDKALLQAEIVRTYADSLRLEEAMAALRTLKRTHPEEVWQTWAQQAEYELTHLMPGMEAPLFNALTVDGTPFSLEKQRGKVVVLEFWSPRLPNYEKQLPQIQQLLEQVSGKPVVWVSIALEPDVSLYQTFAEGRSLPGIQIVEESGPNGALAKLYGIQSLPYYFLLDAEGRIVGKYGAQQLVALSRDLSRLLAAENTSK